MNLLGIYRPNTCCLCAGRKKNLSVKNVHRESGRPSSCPTRSRKLTWEPDGHNTLLRRRGTACVPQGGSKFKSMHTVPHLGHNTVPVFERKHNHGRTHPPRINSLVKVTGGTRRYLIIIKWTKIYIYTYRYVRFSRQVKHVSTPTATRDRRVDEGRVMFAWGEARVRNIIYLCDCLQCAVWDRIGFWNRDRSCWIYIRLTGIRPFIQQLNESHKRARLGVNRVWLLSSADHCRTGLRRGRVCVCVRTASHLSPARPSVAAGRPGPAAVRSPVSSSKLFHQHVVVPLPVEARARQSAAAADDSKILLCAPSRVATLGPNVKFFKTTLLLLFVML